MQSKLLCFSCLALLLAACAADTDAVPDAAPPPPPPPELGLAAPPPGQGFQLVTEGMEIAPGEDVEYCEILQLPGGPDDVIAVGRFETAMSAGSHHLIISAAELGSQADQNLVVGDIMPCPVGDLTLGAGTRGVTGAQQPYHEEGYPAGVGRLYRGGQKLIFDYHYFNAGDAPIRARAALNMWTVDPASIEREVQVFDMMNMTIDTPPGQTRSFTGECRMNHDVLVHRLTRHTHKWGTDFEVVWAGGERDGERAWLSQHYEETDFTFDAPVLVRAGEGFRFTCTFVNTAQHDLVFGLKADDEMCILFGTWWVPEPGMSPGDQDCMLFDVDEDGVARP